MRCLMNSYWSTIQLCSTVNSVQNDAKSLITVSVHEGCYFLSIQINAQHIFTMSAFGACVCFELYTPLVNGCVICALFSAVPNVFSS